MKCTRPYDEQFKKRAVEMLRNSDKPDVQIARKLGNANTTTRSKTIPTLLI